MNATQITREDHVLERMRFAVSHSLSRYGLEDSSNIEITMSRVADALIFQLAMYLYGRRTKGKVVRYPATWWDAFKVRWFRGWLTWALRRWPAQWIEYTPEMVELYPAIKSPIPGQRSVVITEWRS